MYIKANL